MKSRLLFAAVVFLIAAGLAAAAQNVTVIGAVTPGNCAKFFSTTQIQDSGGGCGGGGGSGTVTSVSLSLPNNVFSVSGSPVINNGTLTGTLINQLPNLAFLSPVASPSAPPTFRAISGADLPLPSTLTLGGVEAAGPVTSSWINAINTSGIPQLSQPSFSQISGVASATQIPFPTLTAIGGVEAINQLASNWINSIDTSGVPHLSQPQFSDIAGFLALSQITSSGNNTIISNISGVTQPPSANSLTSILDSVFGPTQGTIIYRGASVWTTLPPGVLGQVLTTSGPNQNPLWNTVSGTGTVTQINAGTGIQTSPSPITASGVVAIASAATNTILANTSSGTIPPIPTSPSVVLDIFGSTIGSILYRGSSIWQILTPGTNGQVLTTNGPGTTPSWTLPTAAQNNLLPGGRITVVSGGCNVTTDQVAQTVLYYAPCAGPFVPIYNGTQVQPYQFTSSATDTVGLSINLASSANWSSTTLYDVFVGLNSGTVTLCTGPAWSNSGSGTSARGTGAGTTQLAIYNGLQTNAVSMTCRSGASTTFTCAVNQCTYLGTVLTGASNGTVDLKFGTNASNCGQAILSIWNAFNSIPTRATVSDSTSSWNYTTAAWRAAHNQATCSVEIVQGLTGPAITATYVEKMSVSASGFSLVGIGINSSSGLAARSSSNIVQASAAGAVNGAVTANFYDALIIGLNTVYAIEQGDGTNSNNFFGNNAAGFNSQQLSFSGLM